MIQPRPRECIRRRVRPSRAVGTGREVDGQAEVRSPSSAPDGSFARPSATLTGRRGRRGAASWRPAGHHHNRPAFLGGCAGRLPVDTAFRQTRWLGRAASGGWCVSRSHTMCRPPGRARCEATRELRPSDEFGGASTRPLGRSLGRVEPPRASRSRRKTRRLFSSTEQSANKPDRLCAARCGATSALDGVPRLSHARLNAEPVPVSGRDCYSLGASVTARDASGTTRSG